MIFNNIHRKVRTPALPSPAPAVLGRCRTGVPPLFAARTVAGRRASSAVKLLLIFGLLLSSCNMLPGMPGLTPTVTASDTPTPPPTVTPTPTIVWFPPTRTPTPGPALATAAATPEKRQALGDVVVQDDFSSQSGWQTGAMDGGTVAYGPNVLSIAIPDQAAALTSLRLAPLPDSYYLEITASAGLCRGKDAYGLIFRSDGKPGGYGYRWIITCDGQMRVERWRPFEAAVIQNWTDFGEGGPLLSLKLGLWLYRDEMRFFVNDNYMFSAHDPLLTGKQIGVFARSTGQNALSVSFSGLVVRAISGYQPSPVPSPTSWVKPTITRMPTATPKK